MTAKISGKNIWFTVDRKRGMLILANEDTEQSDTVTVMRFDLKYTTFTKAVAEFERLLKSFETHETLQISEEV